MVADAVMVAPSGTGSDRVTYTPTLASAETVDIYAKWTETGTRSQEVTYTIHHSGGSSDIQVNQQQPSAGWYHLGMYTMSPGQNHRVEVYGALEGETVADAIRFVSSGVSAPGISYVHADHLGSPQKMTDSAKTVVWDAVYTPFGQVHSITGMATNNQRFPGQYADAETGYSYNYFRDYDPTTGRYIQSDPIGLDGGLNVFNYAKNNPFKFIDPNGLSAVGWIVELGEKCLKKIKALNSEKELRQARRQGKNVLVNGGRQQAGAIERGAFGGQEVLKHSGHQLDNGATGRAHFQTSGKPGHTFWSSVIGTIGGLLDPFDASATAGPEDDMINLRCRQGKCESSLKLGP